MRLDLCAITAKLAKQCGLTDLYETLQARFVAAGLGAGLGGARQGERDSLEEKPHLQRYAGWLLTPPRPHASCALSDSARSRRRS